LGGDDEFAAEAIILSSLLSPFTMGVIIYLFELI
jgi:predicted permease